MKLVGGVLKENIGDGDVREITSETLGDYKADYQTVDKVAHALNVNDILAPFVMKDGGIDSDSIGVGGGATAGITKIS